MIDRKKIVILTTFVMVMTMTMAQHATICDEEELNAFIPNVRNCNAWFRCGVSGPEPGNCSPEFNFNPITRGCDWPENVQCFACPSSGTLTTHIVDRSCRSYIRCVDGVPNQLMCAPGLQFNAGTGHCDFETFAQCWGRFNCPDQLPIDGSIIAVRNPHNCSVFHMCAGNTEPLRQECRSDLHFDPVTGLCTFPNLTDCGRNLEVTEAPRGPVFRCPSDGVHPHPSSCSTYFSCANGQSHEFACPNNLHFNAQTGQCGFPNEADCDRENYRKSKVGI